MKNSFKILLWHAKSMTNAKGLAPVYCRITADGKRVEFSTGVFVEESKWQNKRVKGSSEAVKRMNAKLAEIENAINRIHFELQFRKKPITAARIKEIYLSGGMVHIPTLLECYDALTEQQHKLVGTAIVKGTVNNTNQRRNACKRFIKEYYGLEDLPLDEVKKSTATDMEVYFLSKGFAQSHINKALMHFKRVMNYAHEHEYITGNPLQYLKYKKETKKPIQYLTLEELHLMERCPLKDISVQNTLDVFLFACETGLAYCDVKALSEANLQVIEGKQWIVGNRQKSSTEYAMPLTKRALAILEKHHYQLPVQCNQLTNDNLKLIAIASGITKRLHFHMARKTKATTLLNAGVPESTILKVMGWESVKDFRKRYGKLEMLKVAEDMSRFESVMLKVS